ncbi:MAG: deoxyribodipyrimidine photo-lyase [Syntrophaceae bacterium]|nr:deoxyribodipyrimidine photo-lyase [Syntrophaceae bacterium]
MIHPERIKKLNDRPIQKGQFVLYWMQASQRAEYNHALEYAIRQANEQKLPVVVLFVLTDFFPEANLRHYTFMLEGLQEVRSRLEVRGIQFVALKGLPDKESVNVSAQASMLITDCGYLRIQKEWRKEVAEKAPCLVVQVETDVIVPVEQACPKEAYSAAVLRPKINSQLRKYLVPLSETPVKNTLRNQDFAGLDLKKPIPTLLSSLSIDRTVQPVSHFRGGTGEAKRRLGDFIAHKLRDYGELRSDPSLDCVSHMSPYLHFGQISPLYIALQVQEAGKIPAKTREAYLEELVVRRELAMNFSHYNPAYDSFRAIPDWAQRTLKTHQKEKREYVYSREELEDGRTHDPYWNAAQKEMVITGKMHNYMRMYWGKKILEWSTEPEEAYRIAVYLNNKYELDGRDPNSFTGVAWCFGKHDRPWGERKVFGQVRYMNDAGLRRKFKIDDYVKKISSL